MPRTGDLDSIAELDFVHIEILRQANADHRLQTILLRDASRFLVALSTGEAPNPVGVGLNDA